MAQPPLQVGDRAPTFSLTAGDGRHVRSADLAGQWVVLYFYPKDDTPGCTKEACAFRDGQAAFTKAGAVVLGVSGDGVPSHQRFAGKYGLTFPLLSDPGFAVAKRYGVYKQKWLYGRSFLGIERSTFIIDPQGRLAAMFPRVQVNGHAEAVLEALRGATAQTPASAR